MSDDIRYDLLTQQALRGVVRGVLADVAKKGLPGDHHFYISFNTKAEGVHMSERLRAQYPQEMTIILQHQFWDLTVSDYVFDVGLSFGGFMEKLTIPFDAINGFFDPSVQFGLQFEDVTDGEAQPTPANAGEKPQEKPMKKKRLPPVAAAPLKTEMPPTASPLPEVAEAKIEPKPDKPTSGGGEVVRLDRFRKK